MELRVLPSLICALRSIVSTLSPCPQPIFESKYNPTLSHNPLLPIPSSSFILLRDLPLYLLDSLPFNHVIRFDLPPPTHTHHSFILCYIHTPSSYSRLVCIYILTPPSNCTQLSSNMIHMSTMTMTTTSVFTVHCPPTPHGQVVVVNHHACSGIGKPIVPKSKRTRSYIRVSN